MFTYGAPCQAIGHEMLFLFISVTHGMLCHVIGHRCWIIVSATIFKKAFFALKHFLPYIPSCFFYHGFPWGRQFNLKVNGALCCNLKHSPGQTVCLNVIHQSTNIKFSRELYLNNSNILINYIWWQV